MLTLLHTAVICEGKILTSSCWRLRKNEFAAYLIERTLPMVKGSETGAADGVAAS